MNYPKAQVYQESWSNNNHLADSKFTEYILNQVQYTAGNIQTNVMHFYMHNFKLKTKVITD